MIGSEIGREVFDCVRENDVGAVASLCEKFADQTDSFINWRNNDFGHFGETPLIAAVRRGNVELVSLLITVGANLHLTDWKNRSALTYAKAKGQVQIIDLLVQAGAIDYEAKLEVSGVDSSSKPLNGDMVFAYAPASPTRENVEHVLQIGKRRTTKKGPKPTRASLLRAGLHTLPTASSQATPAPADSAVDQGSPSSAIPAPEIITEMNPQEVIADSHQYDYYYENEDPAPQGDSQPEIPSESTQYQPRDQASLTPRGLAHIPSGVYFDPRFLLSARDLREQQLIQHTPCFLSYYLCIQCGLHEALITCAALSTDVFSTKTALPVEVIDFLGSLVPVPLASVAFTVASKAVDYITTQHMEKCYANLRGLNPAADPVHSSRLVEGLARRLTISQQDLLLSLDCAGNENVDDYGDVKMENNVSSKKSARNVFGRLGISFLSKIKSLLGLGTKNMDPERLAAIHLKEMLNYLFLGNLQADPMQIPEVIEELTSVIATASLEQYSLQGTNGSNAPNVEAPQNAGIRPPKPPKPSSKAKGHARTADTISSTFDLSEQTTTLTATIGEPVRMVELGADNDVGINRRVAAVGESKSCCVIA